jgi:hypothetical protein
VLVLTLFFILVIHVGSLLNIIWFEWQEIPRDNLKVVFLLLPFPFDEGQNMILIVAWNAFLINLIEQFVVEIFMVDLY